jgi:hypothetical protein
MKDAKRETKPRIRKVKSKRFALEQAIKAHRGKE